MKIILIINTVVMMTQCGIIIIGGNWWTVLLTNVKIIIDVRDRGNDDNNDT